MNPLFKNTKSQWHKFSPRSMFHLCGFHPPKNPRNRHWQLVQSPCIEDIVHFKAAVGLPAGHGGRDENDCVLSFTFLTRISFHPIMLQLLPRQSVHSQPELQQVEVAAHCLCSQMGSGGAVGWCAWETMRKWEKCTLSHCKGKSARIPTVPLLCCVGEMITFSERLNVFSVYEYREP